MPRNHRLKMVRTNTSEWLMLKASSTSTQQLSANRSNTVLFKPSFTPYSSSGLDMKNFVSQIGNQSGPEATEVFVLQYLPLRFGNKTSKFYIKLYVLHCSTRPITRAAIDLDSKIRRTGIQNKI